MDQARVRGAIADLGTDPRPAGHTKLVGEDFYRIRVGAIRVVYSIEDTTVIVMVTQVVKRGDAYGRKGRGRR